VPFAGHGEGQQCGDRASKEPREIALGQSNVSLCWRTLRKSGDDARVLRCNVHGRNIHVECHRSKCHNRDALAQPSPWSSDASLNVKYRSIRKRGRSELRRFESSYQELNRDKRIRDDEVWSNSGISIRDGLGAHTYGKTGMRPALPHPARKCDCACRLNALR
jgi:hypothetical protein